MHIQTINERTKRLIKYVSVRILCDYVCVLEKKVFKSSKLTEVSLPAGVDIFRRFWMAFCWMPPRAGARGHSTCDGILDCTPFGGESIFLFSFSLFFIRLLIDRSFHQNSHFKRFSGRIHGLNKETNCYVNYLKRKSKLSSSRKRELIFLSFL